MTQGIFFRTKTASAEEVLTHLVVCSDTFIPPLSETVDLWQYSHKIHDNAVTFEAWLDGKLIGLVAAYFNDERGRVGYITNVSLIREYMGTGIASRLVLDCIHYGLSRDFLEIGLEVNKDNYAARKLYQKCGFIVRGVRGENLIMQLVMQGGECGSPTFSPAKRKMK